MILPRNNPPLDLNITSRELMHMPKEILLKILRERRGFDNQGRKYVSARRKSKGRRTLVQ